MAKTNNLMDDAYYREQAARMYNRPGKVDVSPTGPVSRGTSPGAWVMAFVYVPEPPADDAADVAAANLTRLLRPHLWFLEVQVERRTTPARLNVVVDSYTAKGHQAVLAFDQWAGYPVGVIAAHEEESK